MTNVFFFPNRHVFIYNFVYTDGCFILVYYVPLLSNRIKLKVFLQNELGRSGNRRQK